MYFCCYPPLEMALHLNKLEALSTKDALCQVWLKIDPVILEKKMKMWKAYRHTCIDGHMADDGQQAIRKAHFSFQLRWGKMFTRIQKGGQRENRQYLIGKIHLSSSEIKVFSN